MKYGALRQPPARLLINWHLRQDENDARVILNWREEGVSIPNVSAAAQRKGYGRELIEHALPYQLNANTRLEFTAHGVRCTVELPLERAHDFSASGWRGLRLLIVEDEYFLAKDLASHFLSLGVEVVGPAGTVADALALLKSADIEAAILDVNLRGERIYPVADVLLQRHIPFVFATGYGNELEPSAYARVPRCIKPVDFAVVARMLGIGSANDSRRAYRAMECSRQDIRDAI